MLFWHGRQPKAYKTTTVASLCFTVVNSVLLWSYLAPRASLRSCERPKVMLESARRDGTVVTLPEVAIKL